MKYFLIGIIAISLSLNICGAWWAGPDLKRIELVFGNKAMVEKLSLEMKNSREELYKNIEFYDQPQNYQDREIIIPLEEGRSLKIKRSFLDYYRSFLLRSYGPDEQATLKALSNIQPSKLDFNPKFFIYGGLYLYLLGIFLKVLSIFGIVVLKSDISYYFLHPEHMGMIFTMGKIFGAVFTSFSIYFIYLAGASLYNKRTGLIAALFFSVTPAVAVWSHYLNPHTFTFFWMMLSLCICIKLFSRNDKKSYALAGFSAGLTAGSVLTYGAIGICIPVIQFLKNIEKGIKPALLSILKIEMWLSFLFFLIGFFTVNPYWLVSFKQVSAELGAASTYWPFLPSINHFIYYLRYILSAAFGWPLLLAVLCGLVLAAIKRKREDIILLVLFFILFIYFSSSTTRYMHYEISIIPILIILGARFTDFLLAQKKILKITSILIVAGVLFYTFSYSCSIVIASSRKNIRTIAGEWINENIPAGFSVGMPEFPAPYSTPPFNFFNYKITVTSWDKNKLEKAMPEYFIAEEHQWLRNYTYKNMIYFLKDYKEIKRFEYFPKVLGFQFKRNENSPWDWPDINPKIILFKRNKNNQ